MTKTTKMMKTIMTLLMALALACTAIPVMPATTQTAYAATATNGTIDLVKKALVIPNGQTVKFVSSTTTIPKGCKYQVKAVFGSTTVKSQGTWKSSAPAVATVSKTGLVTAKAAGTTTVKVVYGGKNQTVKVKVVASCKHVWKTTKKATCETAGKKLCTLCGKNNTVKTTECNWKTESYTSTAGYGKPYNRYYNTCNGCWEESERGKWSEKPGSRGVFETDEDIDNHCIDKIKNGNYHHHAYNQWRKKIYLEYHPITITGKYCTTCGGNKDVKESCNICSSLKDHDLSDQAPYWWDNECTALLKLIKANKNTNDGWKNTCPPQLEELMRKNNM